MSESEKDETSEEEPEKVEEGREIDIKNPETSRNNNLSSEGRGLWCQNNQPDQISISFSASLF